MLSCLFYLFIILMSQVTDYNSKPSIVCSLAGNGLKLLPHLLFIMEGHNLVCSQFN